MGFFRKEELEYSKVRRIFGFLVLRVLDLRLGDSANSVARVYIGISPASSLLHLWVRALY